MAVTRISPEATFSMLGADLSIKGDVSASADLHVDGKIEGDISCASLVQGESSEIIGAISAQAARLSGRIEGEIACSELVILKTARIHGDVHYDSLTIEQGAVIDGHLSPRGAETSLMPEPLADEGEEPLQFVNAAE